MVVCQPSPGAASTGYQRGILGKPAAEFGAISIAVDRILTRLLQG
jgi:hypothetical protein